MDENVSNSLNLILTILGYLKSCFSLRVDNQSQDEISSMSNCPEVE